MPISRSVAAHLGQAGAVGQQHRLTEVQRLDRRQAKALSQRRKHEGLAVCIQPGLLRIADQREDAHVAQPPGVAACLQFGVARRRRAGQHQLPLGPQRHHVQQSLDVLGPRHAADVEQERLLAQAHHWRLCGGAEVAHAVVDGAAQTLPSQVPRQVGANVFADGHHGVVARQQAAHAAGVAPAAEASLDVHEVQVVHGTQAAASAAWRRVAVELRQRVPQLEAQGLHMVPFLAAPQRQVAHGISEAAAQRGHHMEVQFQPMLRAQCRRACRQAAAQLLRELAQAVDKAIVVAKADAYATDAQVGGWHGRAAEASSRGRGKRRRLWPAAAGTDRPAYGRDPHAALTLQSLRRS